MQLIWKCLQDWIPRSLKRVTTNDIRHYFNRSFKLCELYKQGGDLCDMKALQIEHIKAHNKKFREAQKLRLKAAQMKFAWQCLEQFATKTQSCHRKNTTRNLDKGIDNYHSDLFG